MRFIFLLVSVSTLLFGIAHAWLRIEGSTPEEITSFLGGFLIFAGILCFVSGVLRGASFFEILLVAFLISIGCGLSIFAVTQPMWAVLVGVALHGLLGFLAYQEHLDEPYNMQNGPISSVHPTLGLVWVNTAGRTRREVYQEAKAMRKSMKEADENPE